MQIATNNQQGEETIGTPFEFYWNAPYEPILSWLPEIYASTEWYFFPVWEGIYLEQINGIVWNETALIGYYDDGIYDNNESLKSGTKYLMVGCWNRIMTPGGDSYEPGSGPITANFFYTLEEILTGEQYAAAANTGGLCDAFYDPVGEGCGYTYKLQSTQILGKPMNTLLYEQDLYDYDSYTK